jgi:tetratricopeptide (TPR) repeat protein
MNTPLLPAGKVFWSLASVFLRSWKGANVPYLKRVISEILNNMFSLLGGSVLLDFARVTEWILPRLRRPATWVYVTVGLALSGATVHFLQSQISAGFEKAADVSASIVEEWKCQRRKASIKLSDDNFTILVSRLKGDTSGTQTQEIIAALGEQGGVQVVPVCQSLQIDVGGEYLAEKIKAMDRGKAILKEWHADLILFGKVSTNAVRIWTVNEHGGCDISDKAIELKQGARPGELESGTKTKLYGAVLKEIAAACRHGDDMNWDLFKKQMRKLTALVLESTLELREEEEQLELLISYYNGLNLLYNHDGDVAWFNAASSFTRVLLNSKPTDRVKLNVLYLFGRALFVKGHKTSDNDAFIEGIKRFEQVLPMIPASAPEWRATALMMRADAHVRTGDDGLAIQDLDEVISLIPVSAPERRAAALMMRADVHDRRGDDGLALQDFDEASRLRPKDPDTLNERCYRLAKIGRLELALADCNESLNFPYAGQSRVYIFEIEAAREREQ